MNKRKIKVLHTFKEQNYHDLIVRALGEHLLVPEEFLRFNSLQDAAEFLEQNKNVDLVILEQKSESTLLLDLILGLVPQANYIICSNQSIHHKSKAGATPLYFASTPELETSLNSALKQMIAANPEFLGNFETEECTLIPDELIEVLKLSPFNAFRVMNGKNETIDLKKITEIELNKLTGISVKKSDYDNFVKFHAEQITQTSVDPETQQEKAIEVIEGSIALVRDLIDKVGFTEDAIKVAKASVEMSLKLMGAKPRMTEILKDLKQKEGDYIIHHSLLLGRLACALAYEIGWQSSTTFFKLTLSAFMHDITLNNTLLAKITDLPADDLQSHLAPDDYKKVKMHPVEAAEYTRKISEVPSDVDQIVLQHHERSDGTGFPRKLNARYISPISALFIIAHQLLDSSMVDPNVTLDTFLQKVASEDPQGAFKKIITSLIEKVPLANLVH